MPPNERIKYFFLSFCTWKNFVSRLSPWKVQVAVGSQRDCLDSRTDQSNLNYLHFTLSMLLTFSRTIYAISLRCLSGKRLLFNIVVSFRFPCEVKTGARAQSSARTGMTSGIFAFIVQVIYAHETFFFLFTII